MPSTFWGSTGLWLLTPILSIPASMQRSQYQRNRRSNSCKRISRISVFSIQSQPTVRLPSSRTSSRSSAKRMALSIWLELRTILPPMAPLNVWCKLSNKRWRSRTKPQKMRCKPSCEITGALRYQPVTRQASCLTDVKSALKLTPYCLHLLRQTSQRSYQVSTVWVSAPRNSSSSYIQGWRSMLCSILWTTTRSRS